MFKPGQITISPFVIAPINSPLEGPAAERFVSVARSLSRSVGLRTDADLRHILDEELAWSKDNAGLNGSQLSYEASIRVLLDLARLGWEVREEGFGVELVAAQGSKGHFSPDEILREKQRTRAVFQPMIDAQLRDPAVAGFISRMESPTAASRKKPVTILIADGAEVHSRINRSHEDRSLSIKPYLQLVGSDVEDKFTGHSLREIWRYFRFSWSIPQFSTPGRQLLYLVRDAGHPSHAVMGIIGLNNCALQMGTDREAHLGWNLEAVTSRLSNLADTFPEKLEAEWLWMDSQISSALEDIDPTGLATAKDLSHPNEKIVAALRRKAQEFDQLRDETLRTLASSRAGIEVAAYPAEAEDVVFGHPPVSEEMLDLEAKPSTNPTMQKARRHLIARKRSGVLAELLHSRLVLQRYRTQLTSPKRLSDALQSDQVNIAINTVLAALKSRHAGINMLEISTCGAIPPYNHILGGKLASLLLFSPQIAADYRRIYEGPSIIASQMKNAPVRRRNELVYLGTTSLYLQGSSQYERLKLPPGIISPDQGELRFEKIGATSGYGTLQFPSETREAVEKNLSTNQQFRDVNSIFGEGPSPKLRKLVAGLRVIGFPPDTLMRHNRPRLIYSVSLCNSARDFLNSRDSDLPTYIQRPEEFCDATERIINFWQTRWFNQRIKHEPSMVALLSAKAWKLGDRLTTSDVPIKERRPRLANTPIAQLPTLWHNLAASGPQVTSDSLSDADFERLHIRQPIDDFIRNQIGAKTSIFLTGNAGDGKTHLLKRLAKELAACGAVVIEDATAVMRRDDLSPVLDQWKRAVTEGHPFCIAINEYPLYRLRQAAASHLPTQAAELSRQVAHRLAYGPKIASEAGTDGVLVLDLSLRNPLWRGFSAACLTKLLSDVELNKIAEKSPQSSLARNLSHLKDPQIQERLLTLFDRLASRGVRATVRELWVLLSRIVLGYRADHASPVGDGPAHWYSECLFQNDSRFPIFAALRTTDPASFSHPTWDSAIEEADSKLTSRWKFGWPRPRATVQPDRGTFQTLKRAFYFEHSEGTQCFSLEPQHARAFHDLLKGDEDSVAKSEVIEAINRAYCPIPFGGIQDSLFVWNGHRFHEQPSNVFVASRRITADSLHLYQPRLPERTRDAFPEFIPDHLALCAGDIDDSMLRVDAGLFQTLCSLRKGLPRKLLADRDTFRLEAFLDQLHKIAPEAERRVLSASLTRRELLEIQLSADGKKYERIIKHS